MEARVAINCPWCEGEVYLSREEEKVACVRCGREVDGHAQLCYLRAMDAAATDAAPTGGKKRRWRELAGEELASSLRAYSGLQEALQGSLSTEQRRRAVETMAGLSHAFAGQLMVSPLEAGFWQKLAVEQNLRRQLAELNRSLAQGEESGVAGTVRRWGRLARRRQLKTSLARLDGQLRSLESQIAFEYAPRRPAAE